LDKNNNIVTAFIFHYINILRSWRSLAVVAGMNNNFPFNPGFAISWDELNKAAYLFITQIFSRPLWEGNI